MNNRKLMGALSILLLAILFMSIGCGDGKRNNKSSSGLRKVNPKTGAGVGNPKDIKAKSAQMTDLRSRFDGMIQGSPISVRDIPAGTYTLDEIASLTDVDASPDNARSLAIGKVSGQGMSPVSNEGAGMVAKTSDENRLISVPMTLTADGAGNFAQPAANDYRTYSCRVNEDGKISHSLDSSGKGSDNLLEKISGKSGNNNLIEGKVGGKRADFTIRKSQSGISILVTVYEKEKVKIGNKNVTITKAMLFNYRGGSQQQQAGQQPGGQSQQPLPSREQTQPSGNNQSQGGGQQPSQPAANSGQNGQIPLDQFQGVPAGLPGSPGNTD